MRSSAWLPAAAIFLTAAAMRLAFLYVSRDNPFRDFLILDSEEYHARALEILRGKGVWSEVSLHGTLYSYILAAIYTVFGARPMAAIVLQSFVGGGTAVFTFLMANRLVERPAAVLAGLAAAFCWPLIFNDSMLLVESWTTALNAAALLAALVWRQGGSRAAAPAVCGAASSLSVLGRGNFMLFLPFLAVWFAWPRPDVPRGRRGLATALFLAVAFAFMAPAIWINSRIAGEFVMTQTGGGLAFYTGNNPAARGVPLEHDGAEWHRLIGLPGDDKILNVAGRDKFYYRKAGEWIRNHPGEWLILNVRKFVYFWNAAEVSDNYEINFYKQYAERLWLKPIPFGILASFALLGMAATARALRRLTLIWLYTIVYSATVALFFVGFRYRAPVLPALAIFAGCGFSLVARAVAGRNPRVLAAAAAALVCFAAFTHGDWGGVSTFNRSKASFSLARKEFKNGNEKEARIALDAALNVADDRPAREADAAFMLAEWLAKEGRDGEAETELKKTASILPDYSYAWNLLGNIMEKRRRFERAMEAYRRATEGRPKIAVSFYNNGRLRAVSGDLNGAEAAWREAVEREPGLTPAWGLLGEVLERQGRFPEAEQAYVKTLELEPGNPYALQGLERARFRMKGEK